jgi:predicted phosphodiesterase
VSKIGILSDIHSNIEALNLSLERIHAEGTSIIYVCGDVVGYGRQPNECCDRLQEIEACVIAGNHDWAVIGRMDYKSTFSPSAIEGIVYTQKNITDANRQWLQSLPLAYHKDNLEFVHASLHEPESWPYLVVGKPEAESQWQDVAKCFAAMTGRICFVGHSHRPAVFWEDRRGNIDVIEPFETWLDLSKERAIVDVGSISDPRDGSDYGRAFIFDTESLRLKMIKIPL